MCRLLDLRGPIEMVYVQETVFIFILKKVFMLSLI